MREMVQSDFKPLCKMLKDKDVMYAYEHAFDDEEAQEWLDRQLKRYSDYGFGLWAVILKETDKMIGQCGLTMQECNDSMVLEIGYLFMKEFWHRGYAAEVFSIIRDTNTASQRIAKRNGMTVTGKLIKHYMGIDMPHLVYSVKRGS